MRHETQQRLIADLANNAAPIEERYLSPDNVVGFSSADRIAFYNADPSMPSLRAAVRAALAAGMSVEGVSGASGLSVDHILQIKG
jgi:hypothetical protein